MARSPRALRSGLALLALVVGYLALALISSAPRSPLRPPLPGGVGIPRWFETGTRWLRVDELSRTALTVVAVIVLVALVAAFAFLCRQSWNGRVGLFPVIAVTLVSLAVVTAGPLVLSRDVYSYASYGRMYALYDTNPYVAHPVQFSGDPFTHVVSEEWRDTPSVYGPAFTLLSAGIARAARNSTASTVWAFKLVAAVAVAVTMFLAAAAARVARPGREAFAAAVIGLNPLMVIHVAGAGHNDALVAVLLAAALLIAVRNAPSIGQNEARPVIAVTVLITLAALVKVIAGIPLFLWLAFLARSSPPGRQLRALGTHVTVATAVTVAITAPLFAGAHTFKAIANVAGREGWASGARLVARTFQAVTGADIGSIAQLALSTSVYAGFLLAFAWLTWRVFRAANGEPGAAWGGGLLLFALAASYLLPWYAAWFLPFVPFLMELGLGTVALAVAGLLTLTGVPAEPGAEPQLWRNMILVVHYVVAPVMLGFLVLAAARVRRLPARLET